MITRSKLKQTAWLLACLPPFLTVEAQAALPEAYQPEGSIHTGTVASWAYIQWFRALAFDGITVVALVISTAAFLVVAKNMISTHSAISEGRKTWGDMGMHGAMGVLLLVFIVFLLQQSVDIL